MLSVVELCRSFAVESLVIFVVEIAVGEVEDISFRSALHLFFGGKGMESEVGSDLIFDAELAIPGARGSCKPTAKKAARRHCRSRSGIGKGRNGGVFLHFLRADKATVGIIIGEGEVGFPFKENHIISCCATCIDPNCDLCSFRCGCIGDAFYRSVLGNNFSQRVGL